MNSLVLPPSVTTKQDLYGLIQEVNNYDTWLNQNEIKERVKAKRGTPPPSLSKEALLLIRTHAVESNAVNRKKIEELIAELKSFYSSAPVVTVTLAAPAQQSLKQQISDWFRTEIAANTLINFTYNRTILGGVVVRAGSHIFDMSFKRRIHESRDKFPEVLENV